MKLLVRWFWKPIFQCCKRSRQRSCCGWTVVLALRTNTRFLVQCIAQGSKCPWMTATTTDISNRWRTYWHVVLWSIAVFEWNFWSSRCAAWTSVISCLPLLVQPLLAISTVWGVRWAWVSVPRSAMRLKVVQFGNGVHKLHWWQGCIEDQAAKQLM